MTTSQRVYLPFKRLFDIVFSIVALIVLSPLFLVVAVIIKLDSLGPVFYQHRCCGKNGKLFNEHKFRTMVAGSDDYTKYLSPEEQEQFRQDYKLENDPRVTHVGKFLRKSRIDEVPQFYNVLKGEMSFVGPRPVAEDEIWKYGDAQHKLLSIKPGLTGYWQVKTRKGTTYPQRVQMQLHYVDSFSLFMDIGIFFETFTVVISGEGAF